VKLFNVDGRRVGYFSFRNFVRPSFAALDAVVAQFRAAGIDDLVIDVRYNGGGLVSVAQYLGGLVGGVRTNGQVFTEFVHNDRNAALNETIRFELPDNALSLDRVFIITTRSSASASELIISALRPFITVVTVGDRTFGKPVGQYSFDFCDKVFHPVAFATRNARGEGDYFDGIAPTCAAADDIGRALGDPLERSLAEALGYVREGRCGAAAAASGLGPRAEPGDGWFGQPVAVDGFRQVLNAW
jgi:C-terminal processing protease CtpA/Prc